MAHIGNNVADFTFYHGIEVLLCQAAEQVALRIVESLPKSNHFPDNVGICDHINSCGYHYAPKAYFNDHPDVDSSSCLDRFQVIPPRREPVEPVSPSYISGDIMEQTMTNYESNPLFLYLGGIWGEAKTGQLMTRYNVGTSKKWGGSAVFWQVDVKGRIRTGKIMLYNPKTGHRIKDLTARTPITWVHSLLKQQGVLPREWELTQCLFGEHLLKKYPDKPVCLVEAEKTAVIASAIMPQCVWVAVGGKTQLGDKVEVLEGRKVVAFPDVDGYDKWVEKCAERPYLGILVSDYLQKNATEEDKRTGTDIADVLIRWLQANPSYVAPKPESEPTPELYPDNPVMREVMKYISPEYWDNVDALIRELDLEFVGVTRCLKKP